MAGGFKGAGVSENAMSTTLVTRYPQRTLMRYRLITPRTREDQALGAGGSVARSTQEQRAKAS